MRNSYKTLAFSCLLILCASCLKQTESITPIAKVQTLAELQREAMMMTALTAGNSELSENAKSTLEQTKDAPDLFYLNIKYNIKDMDVYETADIPNSFEQLSNAFLKTMVKLFLRIKGPQRVEIDPIELDLPDLNLDFDVVKSIKIKRVYFQYNKEFDQSVNNKASFAFVSGLDLSRVGRNKSLLLNYKKVNNRCNYKCIDFTIADGNVFDLIKNNSQSIILKPALTIGSLPKITELRIDGQIDLQIGLKLPF